MDALTAARKVTVFGGTGFLGRRIVGWLLDGGFAVRVASRHPERTNSVFGDRPSAPESIYADVNDDGSILAAVSGAFAVVNAVSLYVERGSQTFHAVHVEAAARLARHSQQSGVERLVHVSGIGADDASTSRYIRSRGQGEGAVHDAFPAATIIRPAVMFGPDDAFLIPLMKLLRILPLFPMFGRGQTALQPSYVENVGQAIVKTLDVPEPRTTYELGGPHIYTYKTLLQKIGQHLEIKRVLVPMPFGLWHALAFFAEMLPHPPVTQNQIELMRIDNTASPDLPGFGALGIAPHSIEAFFAAARRKV